MKSIDTLRLILRTKYEFLFNFVIKLHRKKNCDELTF